MVTTRSDCLSGVTGALGIYWKQNKGEDKSQLKQLTTTNVLSWPPVIGLYSEVMLPLREFKPSFGLGGLDPLHKCLWSAKHDRITFRFADHTDTTPSIRDSAFCWRHYSGAQASFKFPRSLAAFGA